MTEETDDNLQTSGDDHLPESASRQTDVSETTTSEDQDQTPPISPAPSVAEGTPEVQAAQPTAIPATPEEAPAPSPEEAAATELFTSLTDSIRTLTHLADDAAELIAFWVISTWFQEEPLARSAR